jgi:predicted phage gp36 major capsid-like protein
MVAWLRMLNRNPRYKVMDENIKPVAIAYTFMNEVPAIIENSEQRLRQDEEEINAALTEQLNSFKKELADIEEEFKRIKGFGVKTHASKYLEDIDKLNQRIK